MRRRQRRRKRRRQRRREGVPLNSTRTPLILTLLDPTPLDPTPLDPTPLNPAPLDPTPLDPTPLTPTPLSPRVPAERPSPHSAIAEIDWIGVLPSLSRVSSDRAIRRSFT
jgi:hypothetical protein